MELLIHAELHTERNMGDHGESAIAVINCPPGTTIEQLAEHLCNPPMYTGDKRTLRKYDYIVIRAGEVKEAP